MATRTANAAAAGAPPKGLRVGLVAVNETYDLSLSLSPGDVIQMVKVPKDATPIYVAVSMPLGIGVANVGDGLDTDRYINLLFSANAVLQPINTAYTGYTYTADDTIDIQISLVSAGGSAASGTIGLFAIFSMDA